jgi:hypothetical protein
MSTVHACHISKKVSRRTVPIRIDYGIAAIFPPRISQLMRNSHHLDCKSDSRYGAISECVRSSTVCSPCSFMMTICPADSPSDCAFTMDARVLMNASSCASRLMFVPLKSNNLMIAGSTQTSQRVEASPQRSSQRFMTRGRVRGRHIRGRSRNYCRFFETKMPLFGGRSDSSPSSIPEPPQPSPASANIKNALIDRIKTEMSVNTAQNLIDVGCLLAQC